MRDTLVMDWGDFRGLKSSVAICVQLSIGMKQVNKSVQDRGTFDLTSSYNFKLCVCRGGGVLWAAYTSQSGSDTGTAKPRSKRKTEAGEKLGRSNRGCTSNTDHTSSSSGNPRCSGNPASNATRQHAGGGGVQRNSVGNNTARIERVAPAWRGSKAPAPAVTPRLPPAKMPPSIYPQHVDKSRSYRSQYRFPSISKPPYTALSRPSLTPNRPTPALSASLPQDLRDARCQSSTQ